MKKNYLKRGSICGNRNNISNWRKAKFRGTQNNVERDAFAMLNYNEIEDIPTLERDNLKDTL